MRSQAWMKRFSFVKGQGQMIEFRFTHRFLDSFFKTNITSTVPYSFQKKVSPPTPACLVFKIQLSIKLNK